MIKIKTYKIPDIELKYYSGCNICYDKHFHNEVSLGIILRGRTKFQFNNQNIILNSKSIIIIPPFVIHSCNPIKEDWEYYMLYINNKKISLFNKYFNEQACIVDNNNNLYKRLNEVFTYMLAEESDFDKENRLFLILSLLGFLDNKINDKHLEKKENKAVNIIKNYINDNYVEKITLNDLSEISNISKYYIPRIFKKYFSITPNDYLNIVRINHSKKDIKNCLPLVDIAVKNGFYDQSHFSKIFKRIVGITPLSYRNEI